MMVSWLGFGLLVYKTQENSAGPGEQTNARSKTGLFIRNSATPAARRRIALPFSRHLSCWLVDLPNDRIQSPHRTHSFHSRMPHGVKAGKSTAQ